MKYIPCSVCPPSDERLVLNKSSVLLVTLLELYASSCKEGNKDRCECTAEAGSQTPQLGCMVLATRSSRQLSHRGTLRDAHKVFDG